MPSRSDCPGYEAPLEKTPRQIDSYSGDQLPGDNYYPSGERRPGGGEDTFGVAALPYSFKHGYCHTGFAPIDLKTLHIFFDKTYAFLWQCNSLTVFCLHPS